MLALDAFRGAASAVHQLNHQLRKLGMTPTEVGRSELVDAAKFQALRKIRKLDSVKRRFIAPTPEKASPGY